MTYSPYAFAQLGINPAMDWYDENNWYTAPRSELSPEVRAGLSTFNDFSPTASGAFSPTAFGSLSANPNTAFNAIGDAGRGLAFGGPLAAMAGYYSGAFSPMFAAELAMAMPHMGLGMLTASSAFKGADALAGLLGITPSSQIAQQMQSDPEMGRAYGDAAIQGAQALAQGLTLTDAQAQALNAATGWGLNPNVYGGQYGGVVASNPTQHGLNFAMGTDSALTGNLSNFSGLGGMDGGVPGGIGLSDAGLTGVEGSAGPGAGGSAGTGPGPGDSGGNDGMGGEW